jgi:hypothetical protein
MRLRRTIALIALVALLVVAASAVALAESEATVAGRGWLVARGTGTATLDMGGWIKMKIDGDVTINDFDGDLSVRIASSEAALDEAEDRRGPEVVLRDFEGYLVVRGSHFLLKATGTMKFKAHGHGFAYLVGEGIYKTRRGLVRPWDEAAAGLDLGGAAA